MNGVSGRGATDGVGEHRAVGSRGTGRGTWAERLGSSLPLGLNKNVLEIVLEKDEKGSFNVSDTDCARVMGKLGLDPRPDIHVESIHIKICPQGIPPNTRDDSVIEYLAERWCI